MMFIGHDLLSVIDQSTQTYKDCMSSVKFDLGDISNVVEFCMVSTHSFFEIPAPICLFQVRNEFDITFFLAKQDCGGTIWQCFHKNESDGFRWVQEDLEMFINSDASNIFISRISDNYLYGKQVNGVFINDKFEDLPETVQRTLERFLIVAASIEVFSCSNVITVDNTPPKFINQKRIKKGKVPFFLYKTLHISDRKQYDKSAAKKGSHASPRLHLRRGHIRKLEDGKRIWISSCLVGDKTKGIIQKEYSTTN